ncbi:MAG: biotin/lipoyl-binding protein, partial [Methanosarcina mazei]
MKKKKLWVSVIAVLSVSSLAFMVFSNRGEALEVTVVKKGDIKEYVEDIGTVRCKEQRAVSIEGSGLIQKVNAETGQKVKKGELLLSMDKELLRIQLRDAEEKIKEIEASIPEREIKNYINAVDKAGIAVNRAKDDYKLALDDFNNAKVLSEAGAVSMGELKQKEAALKAAQALLNTAEIDLRQIEANTPDSVKAAYEARLKQAVLNRESILHSLEKQDLSAPIDGVVLERHI